MPIIVQHGDAALTGEFAREVGDQTGRTAQRQRQQQLDQQLTLQALAQAHEARMNAGPSFAERSRMSGSGRNQPEGVRSYRQAVSEGRPGQNPLDRLKDATRARKMEDAQRKKRDELLDALDRQVPEDKRDLDYQINRQKILSGDELNEAALKSVRPESDEEDGQPFEPSSFGKVAQQRIRSGAVGDLVGKFSERDKPADPYADAGSGPLSRDALEARAILDNWTRNLSTTDADLATAAKQLEDSGADLAAISTVKEEIKRRDELMKAVQYPIILEGAQATAAARWDAFVEQNGVAPTVKQARQIHARALQEQIEALGVEVQDVREWRHEQMERENATKAIQREIDNKRAAEETKRMELEAEQEAQQAEGTDGAQRQGSGSQNTQRGQGRPQASPPQQARPNSGQRGF
jgi:hypothetical protein